MSFFLRKGFNSYSKSLIFDKIFFFPSNTSIPFVNHGGRINNYPNQILFQKLLRPIPVYQHRYYSINFSDSALESITTSEATKFVTDILIKFHDLSGLHWWGTLVAAPLLLKLFYTIPCAIYQHKLMAKTELITIQSKPLITNLKHELLIEGQQKRWPVGKLEKDFRIESRRLMKKIMIDNNIHPFKLVILSLVQMPPWILTTMSLSKLSKDISSGTSDSLVVALQFPVGGPFWCPDLSLPDPTFILPITFFLFMLANCEVNWLLKPQQKGRMFKIISNLYRLVAGILFVIALQVPSGLSLFWTSNAILGFAQHVLLVSPKVRRLLLIPKTPSELEKPYSHLVENVRGKWNRLFSRT